MTQAVLAELDDRGIGFITLRARHPGITKTLAALPPERLEIHDPRPGRRPDPPRQSPRRPRLPLSAYPRPIRQLPVTGLGPDQATLLITNRPALPATAVIHPTPGG